MAPQVAQRSGCFVTLKVAAQVEAWGRLGGSGRGHSSGIGTWTNQLYARSGPIGCSTAGGRSQYLAGIRLARKGVIVGVS